MSIDAKVTSVFRNDDGTATMMLGDIKFAERIGYTKCLLVPKK